MSKSASFSAEPFDLKDAQTYIAPGTPAWKQEVNERLAAHRTRRGGPQDARDARPESTRTASSRAAEAAARVAARYAKAPSYSQLLAGEARAVVRAAGAAAEAARNAQAAAEAVLAGLEAGQLASGESVSEAVSDGSWDDRAPRLNPYVPAQSFAAPESYPALAQQTVAPAGHVSASRWQDEPPAGAGPVVARAAAQGTAPTAPWIGAQPRWEEALPVTAPAPAAGRDVWSEMRVYPRQEFEPGGEFEHEAEGELFPYDAFDSHDPVGSATIDPVQHIPANLIEFPRELVATKKARPRLAEGPLYTEQESPQLNIFEVDPEQLAPPIYLSSASGEAVAPPEWASIELDHLDHVPEAYYAQTQVAEMYGTAGRSQMAYVEGAVTAGVETRETSMPLAEAQRVAPQTTAGPGIASPSAARPASAELEAVELLVAPVSDRLLAGVVDAALVMLAFLAAAVVVIAATAHPPSGKIALIASAFGLLLFGLLYQFLFLSYAEEGTPGMRYARIALCTFDDDNPSRAQMRQRIPAFLLAAIPAGLGLLWAMFDGQHLGWHDRMTRTYQRKY